VREYEEQMQRLYEQKNDGEPDKKRARKEARKQRVIDQQRTERAASADHLNNEEFMETVKAPKVTFENDDLESEEDKSDEELFINPLVLAQKKGERKRKASEKEEEEEWSDDDEEEEKGKKEGKKKGKSKRQKKDEEDFEVVP